MGPIAALALAQARRRGIAALADAFAVLPAHVRMIVEVKAVLGDVELPSGPRPPRWQPRRCGESTASAAAPAHVRLRPLGDPGLHRALAGSGVEVGLTAEASTEVARMTH